MASLQSNAPVGYDINGQLAKRGFYDQMNQHAINGNSALRLEVLLTIKRTIKYAINGTLAKWASWQSNAPVCYDIKGKLAKTGFLRQIHQQDLNGKLGKRGS